MSIVLLCVCSLWCQTGARRVAVTIDDLPGTTALDLTGTEVFELNTKLVAALQAEKIPIIGFVNEGRLYRTGEVDNPSAHSTCGRTLDSTLGITPSAKPP